MGKLLNLLIITSSVMVAAPLAVTNPGFETDVLGSGGFQFTISGWTCTNGANSGDICGVYNPTASQYSSIPSSPNVAFSNGGIITQVLGTNLAPGMVYTLSVDIGKRLDSGFPGYVIELLAGSTVLVSNGITLNPTAGTFQLQTLTYTSSASGGPLEILLQGNSGSQTNFDSVSLLAVSAVPEPSTLALAIISLLGIAVVSRLRVSFFGRA
jgi:hypothetical protein